MRGVVAVVTGGGKTAFAEMAILRFRNAYPDGVVVIVVPTTALLDQWAVSLQEDIGADNGDIATFSSAGHSVPSSINIFVINTARRIEELMRFDAPCLLVVDECHRAGSAENIKALSGKYVAALGLSATPERQYDSAFEDQIVPLLGPIIYRYSYEDASRDGVITPFELVNVQVKLLDDEQEAYDALTKKVARLSSQIANGSGGSEEDLAALLRRRSALSASAAMRIPVAVAMLDSRKGQRTIVFHERLDAADILLRNLVARGHRATIYTTRVPEAVRRDNLRMFRRGLFDVLVSCRALDEGTNIPETSVALIASSTASTRQRIQRLGRVLRPAEGKSHATVITLYATKVEQQRLEDEAGTYSSVALTTWIQADRLQ